MRLEGGYITFFPKDGYQVFFFFVHIWLLQMTIVVSQNVSKAGFSEHNIKKFWGKLQTRALLYHIK